MRDLRNELNMECPRPKGAYLSEAPEEIWGDPNWILEEKVDGERWTMQLGSERSMLVGRNRKNKLKGVEKAGPFMSQNDRNPYLAGLRSRRFAGTILDGECTEIYKQDGTYDKATIGRVEVGDFVGFTTWGVLMLNGLDARALPEDVRWQIAKIVVEELYSSGQDSKQKLRLASRVPATKENLQIVFDAGYEGVVLKNLQKGIPINQVTNPFWWKVKGDKNRTVDAFIVGVTEGKEGGSGVNGIKPVPNGKAATFTVAMMDEVGRIVEVGKLEALPDELRELGFEFFGAYQGRVVELLASGWDGRALRFPRFVRWRTDKTAFDCKIAEQIGCVV